jgi:transglutaminase-like putative cysteine protease
VDWKVGLLGSVLFAGVVVVSALLFLAIPRFQLENSLFLERFITKKAKTGFSDNIKFGDVTDIMSDDSVALSIDVTDPRKVPTPLYLRMVVLDEYREGTFKLSTELRRDAKMQREANRARIAGTEPPTKEAPVYWTFYFESGISRYLPLPGAFELLTFRETQNVAASAELRTVALHAEPVSMLAYRLEGVNTASNLRDVEFSRRFRQTRASSEVLSGPAQKRMQLALPLTESDSVVLRRAIADFAPGAIKPGTTSTSLGQPGMSAEEFSRRACAWLQSNHTYSLQSALPKGDGDPLVRWIGSKEPGHCELFAGSLVALARTAGYPARMVSGFRTGTWNGFSNSLAVRNSEAHAWCEVWSDAESSWLRVDPTPGATAVANAVEESTALARERRLDRSLKAWVNSLRVFWYRRIVNFDQRSQLESLQNVKRVTQDKTALVRAAMEQTMKALRAWLTSPWDLRRSIMAAAALLGLAGLGWCIRLFLRDWRWRFAKGRRVTKRDPVRTEAGRWLQKFQREAETDEVMEELRRLRYGARETWPEPRLVFERARVAWRATKRRRAESPPYR